MPTLKVVRDVDPLTRIPSAYRYEAENLESVADHFDSEARREQELAEHSPSTFARQHRGAAKAWKQAATILRATTLVVSA